MTYHIDQLGRIVKQVPHREPFTCRGCIYFIDGETTCFSTGPVENLRPDEGVPRCVIHNSIYVLVDTTP